MPSVHFIDSLTTMDAEVVGRIGQACLAPNVRAALLGDIEYVSPFDSMLLEAVARLDHSSIEVLKLAGAQRSKALELLRRGELEKGSTELSLAYSIGAKAKSNLSRQLIKSFNMAVLAYETFKRTEYWKAVNLLEAAYALDTSLIENYNLSVLQFHRIQLFHNKCRVLMRLGDEDSAFALIVKSLDDCHCLEAKSHSSSNWNKVAIMMIDQLRAEVGGMSTKCGCLKVTRPSYSNESHTAEMAFTDIYIDCLASFYGKEFSDFATFAATAISNGPLRSSVPLLKLVACSAVLLSRLNDDFAARTSLKLYKILGKIPKMPRDILVTLCSHDMFSNSRSLPGLAQIQYLNQDGGEGTGCPPPPSLRA